MKALRYAGRQYKYNFNFGLSTTFIYKGDEILMSFWGELSESEVVCAISGYNQGNKKWKLL